jgi:hypothetical protein
MPWMAMLLSVVSVAIFFLVFSYRSGCRALQQG